MKLLDWRFFRQFAPAGFGSVGSGTSQPLAISFVEGRPVILPFNLACCCAAAAFSGALARVLVENKKDARPARHNWITFAVCAIAGVPAALALAEQMFLQPWGRPSFFLFVFLSVLVGFSGQGVMLSGGSGALAIWKIIISRGKEYAASFGKRGKK